MGLIRSNTIGAEPLVHSTLSSPWQNYIQKAKQQEWFVGVFNEAANADMETEDKEYSGQKTEVHF